MITYRAGCGRLTVCCRLFRAGEGVVAHLFGGERPHVGAVALAMPRPSLRDPRKTSATASVLTVVGHKDDELARPAALLLASRCGVPAVVVAGVHIEGAGHHEIGLLMEHARRAVEGALKAWQRLSSPT
ncbi:MAG: hypothetical protein IMW96_00975 [Thermoanaerobacteraceae bacterium]|uniref:prenylated flavin chaperone LpdD n=1 Tax=Thermanaeromonas sp. C210 TaxID=2731925 RepID=UPI00155C6A61|nr:hypothetical protein [Thermanaeromonas sp. C210]MBE3580204.1 hypothetical protein [Thermoanaerobacteraceae bacterium]GFN22961.1 hypothetical protein TAMC210_12780 [Thermanaeromonas sp. C210]